MAKPVNKDQLPEWMRDTPNLRARREEYWRWKRGEFGPTPPPGEGAGNGEPDPSAPRRPLPEWLERLQGSDRARMEMGAGLGLGSMHGGPGEKPNTGDLPPWLPGAAEPHEPTAQEVAIAALLKGLWRQNEVFSITFLATPIPQLIRPREDRKYLFVQNQDPLLTIILGINQPPGPVAGIPANGLLIPGNFGFYEPLVVPQGEIWIAAGAVPVPGILLYSA